MKTGNSTERSLTQPDLGTHPVKSFLHECGMDTSGFPSFRLLIETTEKYIRSSGLRIPLRIPGQPGLIYESYCRILRVLEVPAITKTHHRKFLEIEWSIEEVPVLETESHPSLFFLAGETACPSCRESFQPHPDIIDEVSVRIVCPQCLHQWIMKIESGLKSNVAGVQLLLDAFYENPSHLRRALREEHPGTAETYFPVAFEAWNSGSSLDWLFGDQKGWFAITAPGEINLEVLGKSLINTFCKEYFIKSRLTNSADPLEQTEITRKEDTLTPTDTSMTTTVSIAADFDRSPAPTFKSSPRWSYWITQTTLALLGVASLSIMVLLVWDQISPHSIDPSKPESTAMEIPKIKENKKEEVVKTTPPPVPAPKPLAIENPVSTEALAHYRRGMIHLRKEEGNEAIQDFKKAIQIDHENAPSYRGLGLAFVSEHRYDEAIQAFQQYLLLAKNSDDKTSVEEIIEAIKERVLVSR